MRITLECDFKDGRYVIRERGDDHRSINGATIEEAFQNVGRFYQQCYELKTKVLAEIDAVR